MGQCDEVIGKIEVANQHGYQRHDQITHHGINNFSKGRTHNHANGQINHIAFEGELFEFFEHGQTPRLIELKNALILFYDLFRIQLSRNHCAGST